MPGNRDLRDYNKTHRSHRLGAVVAKEDALCKPATSPRGNTSQPKRQLL